MSESKQRQFHTSELKATVGLEAIWGIKTLDAIALVFGVHPVQVGQRKKEIQDHAKTLFEGKRGPKLVATHREADVVYRSGVGVGAMILDKYLRNEKYKKSGTEVVKESPASDARVEESANAGQRRPAASEVKCTA